MTASDVEKTTASSTSPSAKSAVDTAKSDGPADKRKEAMNHFVAGKRHLLVKDLNSAVTSLALACELMSAEYGETANECADAYYYYGKALLEMARAESGVFGNALDGVPDGEDTDNSQVEDPEKMTEDERDDVEKKVGEALDENFTVLEEKKEMREKRAESTGDEETEEDSAEGDDGASENASEKDAKTEDKDGKADDKDGKAEEKVTEPEKEKSEVKDNGDAEKGAKDEESVGDGDVDAKEGEDKKEQEAEDEEDPSNLQLAWEMLELAKVAYTNHLNNTTADAEKKVLEIKICEVLLTLGEVSLESETYEQAVADITECLNKRKVLYEADSRRIAETHYHLGVALGHFNKFDEAVSALQQAISCIKLRIDNLKESKESKDESKADDAFYTRETEITELEALVPEIEEKIQDTKDMKEQSNENQAEESTGFTNGEESTPAKPISTISVKRKADGSDSISPKKAHVENGDK